MQQRLLDWKNAEELWRDFLVFASAQLLSTDIDPVYPVLKAAFAAEQLAREQVMWRLVLYLTFYDLGSAETWWTREPEASLAAVERIDASRTGIERRGMRGNTVLVRAFLSDALSKGVLDHDLLANTHCGADGWRQVRAAIQECRGAGPWASYKWADLLTHVVGCDITADDIGIGGGGKNAGPVPGLARLTGCEWQQCSTDRALQVSYYERAREGGVQFAGLQQFETSLCDFNSLAKGHYYVGNDIDQMMAQLSPESRLWAARRAAIPAAYLGELHGWSAPDKARRKHYIETGEIVCR